MPFSRKCNPLTLAALLLLPFCILFPASPGACKPGENLLTNGGFEAGTAAALPDWDAATGGTGAALDDQIHHGGTRSLRVGIGRGLRSRRIPYTGGRIYVCGWMKTDSVVTGASAPWHKAALQLESFDAAGQLIGHDDINMLDGTQDWTLCEGTFLLSRAVRSVAVHCHIWGDDARGAAWFDDVSLSFLDDPAQLPHRPLDLEHATITADFSKDRGPFRHLWQGSDVVYSDRAETGTQVQAMRAARPYGFRYVRLHDCIRDPDIYHEDAQGNPVYRWDLFDRFVGAVVDNGMFPVIVLETMPPALASHVDDANWTNPYPPKDAASYRKWQSLVREVVTHCRQKWGSSIHQWYFEVWNEPDANGYFRGTQEEYFKIYDHAVAGATAADPDIRIGGPGGATTNWCRPLLEHCLSGRNDATGGKGCRIDFLSWHIYTTGVGYPVFDSLRLSLNNVRSSLKQLPRYRKIPTLITEWGCSSSSHPVHDRPYDAAFRTMAVREFLDADITLALPFSLGEGPQHAHEGFLGGLALFTKTTIPKPSFRAFELLQRMNGRRVACLSENDPVDGIACISPDRKKAWVMLYNLIEEYTRAPYETAVTVKLKGLPPGQWRCRTTAIAPGKCDPFLRWTEMGSPETLSPAQRTALLQASQLPAAEPVTLQGNTLRLAMPGFSVLQLELQREN